MTKSIFFIESSYTGAGELMIQRSIEKGIFPYLLVKDITPYQFVDKYPELKVITINTEKYDDLVNKITDISGNGDFAITTTDDYSVEIVSRLQEHFELIGNFPDDVIVCRNKYELRRKLSNLAPKQSIQYWKISQQDKNLSLLEELEYPLIVKPSNYTGSIGIKLCRSSDEVVSHLNEYSDYIPPGTASASCEWLLEEVIVGVEYSAEFLEGSCLGLTKKFKTHEPHFVEVGHIFPAPLPENITIRIKRKLESIVEKLGLRHGPLHLEFFLNNQEEIKIVEINGRLPGDRIPVLVFESSGFDIFSKYLDTLFGIPHRIECTPVGYTGIRFQLSNEINTVRSVCESFEHMVVDSQLYQCEKSSCESNLDRCGYVILKHKNNMDLTSFMRVDAYVED